MKNKIIYFLSTFLPLISIIFTFDSNFSIESKYGKGILLSGYDSDDLMMDDTYKYSEHILDINLSFNNGLYFNTQLEYSKPPVFGKDLVGLNNFYIEYELNNSRLKAGDIYTLYGRGLTINMFQDQVIDYDNGLRGLEFNYYLNDDITLFGVAGVKEFEFRTGPTERISNLGLSNTAFFTGIEYIGFHYLYLYEQSIINYTDGSLWNAYTLIGDLPSTGKDTLNTNEHNFSGSISLFESDIYIENSQVSYNTPHGKDKHGTKLYGSIYRDIFGFGVTYEYKNYSMEDYIPTLSNPPIVYRESNSSLTSRNSHAIDWSDEVGHQLDINRYINDTFSIEMNLSIAYKHKEKAEFFNGIDAVKFSKDIYDRSPFRQFYIGSSGWLFNDKLYYKIGYNNYNELKSEDYKHTKAITVPTLFTYTIGENSITAYIEKQSKTSDILTSEYDIIPTWTQTFSDRYLSVTFNYRGKVSLSTFFEDEYRDRFKYGEFVTEYDSWNGLDISYNINSTTQLSLFYGSQKGGLVCANGVCADQPGFDDGMKLTFRSLF